MLFHTCNFYSETIGSAETRLSDLTREFCVCYLRSGDTDCSGTFSALMKYPETFMIGLAVKTRGAAIPNSRSRRLEYCNISALFDLTYMYLA